MFLLYEPTMAGFGHAEVNAGFVATFRRAYPQERIVFCAEATHVDAVRGRLPAWAKEGVDFQPIALSDRDAPLLRRAPQEARQVADIFRRARRERPELVLVLSVGASMLHMLRFAFRALPRVRCAVVPHSILGSLAWDPKGKKRFHPMRFDLALRAVDIPNLRVWLLGPSIEKVLLGRYPMLAPKVDVSGHPYLFEEPPPIPPEAARLRFAIIGGVQMEKGGARMYRFLEALERDGETRLADLAYVGIPPKTSDPPLPSWIDVPRHSWLLPRSEYVDRIRASDYMVMFHEPLSYLLTASGSSFDAVAHARPVLAIRNAFFEEMFAKVGPFGELVDTEEELLARYRVLARRGRDDTWRAWRSTIVSGRARIDIGAHAAAVRDILARWPTSSA